jgi:hypothetical protein
LEEEFSTTEKSVKIPDEDAEKIKTVQDAVDYLKNKGMSDADVKPQTAQPIPAVAKTSAAPKTTPRATPAATPQKKTATSTQAKTAPKSVKTVKNTKTE